MLKPFGFNWCKPREDRLILKALYGTCQGGRCFFRWLQGCSCTSTMLLIDRPVVLSYIYDVHLQSHALQYIFLVRFDVTTSSQHRCFDWGGGSRQISTHLNSCTPMMQASVVHSEVFFKIKLNNFMDTFILKNRYFYRNLQIISGVT